MSFFSGDSFFYEVESSVRKRRGAGFVGAADQFCFRNDEVHRNIERFCWQGERNDLEVVGEAGEQEGTFSFSEKSVVAAASETDSVSRTVE